MCLCSFGPYFCDPVIAGLDPATNKPFICSTDLIGCINLAEDFVVAGTCSPNLYGMCESLYKPNLVRTTKVFFFSFLFICVSWTQEPEELFETISQAILNAFDRDALSGWGAVVHVMYKISPSSKLFLFFSKTRHKQIQYTQLGHHSHTQDPHGLKTINENLARGLVLCCSN